MAGPDEEVPDVEIAGKTYKALADGKYDVICCGTGLKECILAGMLSHKGKKVFMLDKNSYYGGETASLNLTSLYQRFVDPKVDKAEDVPKEWVGDLGSDRDYNVDMIPKFIMADGKLVKTLLETGVVRYLEATGINKVDGAYVFSQAAGKGWFSNGKPGIEKVPATESEALGTPLLGLLQKNALRSFLSYLSKCETPRGPDGTDLSKIPMSGLYKEYSLDADTQDFVGHAMALQADDSYKGRSAWETVQAIRLYASSLVRHGGSPFLYPVYGLSTLPEAFSRDCAVRGGTFMLNRGIDEVIAGEDGRVLGVRAGDQAATAPVIIGSPEYFGEDKCKVTGKVIRTIILLRARPACLPDGVESAQIIVPQKQVGREHDIYISVLSGSHQVVRRGFYVAIVSTTVETAEPKREVDAGLVLLGDGSTFVKRFDSVVDTKVPVEDGSKSGLFISSSYDASSHFESTMTDALAMYRRITGEDFFAKGAAAAGKPAAETAEGAAGGGGATA